MLSFSGTTRTVVGEGGNISTGNQVISHWMEREREREREREVVGWVVTHKPCLASETITTTTTVHI